MDAFIMYALCGFLLFGFSYWKELSMSRGYRNDIVLIIQLTFYMLFWPGFLVSTLDAMADKH
jgi:hypothetical protein